MEARAGTNQAPFALRKAHRRTGAPIPTAPGGLLPYPPPLAQVSAVNARFALLALALCSAAAFARSPALPGEAQYRKALPLLAAANQQIAGMDRARAAGQAPDAAAKPYRAALQANLRQAFPLLEQAAGQKHPVAEFRLAQLLANFAPDEKNQRRACELLGDSLRQGFAPAALELAALCPQQAAGKRFLAQAEAAAKSTRYAAYFPQPSFSLGWCSGETSQSLVAPQGSQARFQMDVLQMLASKAPPARREDFLTRAAAKGCARAQQVLAPR